MGLFGISWGTIGTAAAVGLSFIPGGAVVSGLVGAGAGAIQAISQGKGWEQVVESTLVGGALGAIPGGLIGGAARGLMEGGGAALARSFRDIPDLLSPGMGGALDRLAMAGMNVERPVLGGLVAGASTAAGLAGWDKLQNQMHASSQPAKPEAPKKDLPAELPTRIISSSSDAGSGYTPAPESKAV
ncbi:hypothetical protein OG874_22480 [Nocardia sp. NBC_00565]|uniref:hypothetical protein n=1 Tax=Nocardia sp. NBC_00565 TaxID=2975993 RepID=UPI002E80F86F|nr:hypothetical protein [Nocardia sp. NBC_00565]WUC07686.1 hypothetical protein OG874_22480 [Nocardia sp. NBC_00565]